MAVRAIFLNCTLKPSPDPSNTEALIRKVAALMERQGVETEIVRIADHPVGTGISSDLGEGDAWPPILERIYASNIVVLATPIWLGELSSICQRVIERLDATFGEYDDETGQFPLYNKVGAVIVTGNEDGAQKSAEHCLFALQSLGCTIPPNADVYWVGDAGPGPSYIEAGAEKHFYTNKIASWMAYNTVWMARLLAENPCPTNLTELSEEQKALSDEGKPDPHQLEHERAKQ